MPASLERYFQALQARADGVFAFRYDNAKHFSTLATFSHHKHDGDEEHVVAHTAPTLADVLLEIETLLQPS